MSEEKEPISFSLSDDEYKNYQSQNAANAREVRIQFPGTEYHVPAILHDAYWLRMFAGMAMQGLIYKHFSSMENYGYRISQCLYPECLQAAEGLLNEIKKVEEQKK